MNTKNLAEIYPNKLFFDYNRSSVNIITIQALALQTGVTFSVGVSVRPRGLREWGKTVSLLQISTRLPATWKCAREEAKLLPGEQGVHDPLCI